MRSFSLFAAAALLAAGAACRKPAQSPGRLGSILAAARTRPPCAGVIDPGWAASIPLPTGRSAGEFAVFFYALSDRQSVGRFAAPAARAVIDLDSPAAESCVPISGATGTFPIEQRFGARALRLGAAGLAARRARLYRDLPAIASDYAGGAPLSPAARERMSRFIDSFALLAEPPFLADYGALSPGFWRWARNQGFSAAPIP